MGSIASICSINSGRSSTFEAAVATSVVEVARFSRNRRKDADVG